MLSGAEVALIIAANLPGGSFPKARHDRRRQAAREIVYQTEQTAERAAASAAARLLRLCRHVRDAKHRVGKFTAKQQSPPLFAPIVVAPLNLFEERHGARKD